MAELTPEIIAGLRYQFAGCDNRILLDTEDVCASCGVLALLDIIEDIGAAIKAVEELCDEAKPGLSLDPADCTNTCLDRDCTCSGLRRAVAWNLDPAEVRAALTGATDDDA